MISNPLPDNCCCPSPRFPRPTVEITNYHSRCTSSACHPADYLVHPAAPSSSNSSNSLHSGLCCAPCRRGCSWKDRVILWSCGKAREPNNQCNDVRGLRANGSDRSFTARTLYNTEPKHRFIFGTQFGSLALLVCSTGRRTYRLRDCTATRPSLNGEPTTLYFRDTLELHVVQAPKHVHASVYCTYYVSMR